MAIQVLPSYRLSLRVLQQFLKKKYPESEIKVELKLDDYVLTLPESSGKISSEELLRLQDQRDHPTSRRDSSEGIAS
jgi:hypothetical protein